MKKPGTKQNAILSRSGAAKGIVAYYGSGVWKGDLKSMRRNRIDKSRILALTRPVPGHPLPKGEG